jgi:hypothetical protein
MIISLWNLLQYHSIVRWAIQAQWAEPLVYCKTLYRYVIDISGLEIILFISGHRKIDDDISFTPTGSLVPVTFSGGMEPVVFGHDDTGSCKSNYHTITTAP